MQGEEDEESCEGFDLYNDAKFSAGKERNPLLQTAQSLCQKKIPDFLETFTAASWGDFFHGCV